LGADEPLESTKADSTESLKEKDKKDLEQVSCSIIITKNPCWKNTTIKGKIEAPELLRKGILAEFTIAENIVEKVVEFECVRNVLFGVELDFNPKVLQSSNKNKFRSKSRWIIPYNLPENVKKWQAKLCFPDELSGIYDPHAHDKACSCIKDKLE
jgi:hypothetical protein